jgi:anti-anti-sigma factor
MAPRSLLEVIRCGHHELELRGELCIASLDPLAAALAEIDGAVTLDMADLLFMDSTGLGVILRRLVQGPVTLLDVPPQVERVLQLAGLVGLEGLEIRPARPTGD